VACLYHGGMAGHWFLWVYEYNAVGVGAWQLPTAAVHDLRTSFAYNSAGTSLARVDVNHAGAIHLRMPPRSTASLPNLFTALPAFRTTTCCVNNSTSPPPSAWDASRTPCTNATSTLRCLATALLRPPSCLTVPLRPNLRALRPWFPHYRANATTWHYRTHRHHNAHPPFYLPPAVTAAPTATHITCCARCRADGRVADGTVRLRTTRQLLASPSNVGSEPAHDSC